MEQSASRSASTSFTPSPVMATVCPTRFMAATSFFFWSGVARPKTVMSSAAFASSASVLSVRASTNFSASGIPARRATSETVRGLSPEMTFVRTPCCAK